MGDKSGDARLFSLQLILFGVLVMCGCISSASFWCFLNHNGGLGFSGTHFIICLLFGTPSLFLGFPERQLNKMVDEKPLWKHHLASTWHLQKSVCQQPYSTAFHSECMQLHLQQQSAM
jgi:hypothetical protein